MFIIGMAIFCSMLQMLFETYCKMNGISNKWSILFVVITFLGIALMVIGATRGIVKGINKQIDNEEN